MQDTESRDSGNPVYLVDASIYIFRAWYSIPDGFANPSGQPTNAIYGFTNFLCELLEQVGQAPVVVAFDESLETSFRNRIYPEYKANREPAPEDLKRQFAWCRQAAEALGLPCYSDHEYEADDLIGSLAKLVRADGHRVVIVSADKDLTQLLVGDDYLWDYARGQRVDRAAVKKRFGVFPEQIADYLALTGDAVDNIPGVPGIGPKTAASLLNHFKSVAELQNRLDEIQFLKIRGAKSIQSKIRENLEALDIAYKLTIIQPDILDKNTEYSRQSGSVNDLEALLDELGFGQMLRRRCRQVIVG